MTNQEFREIVKPKITILWHFAGKMNVEQWKQWEHALVQFEVLTLENAVIQLYQQGAKYASPRLNEILAIAHRMNGSVERKEQCKSVRYYDLMRSRYPYLSKMTNDEVTVTLLWWDWKVYRKEFGDSEHAVMISWRRWQDKLRKIGKPSKLQGGEKLEEVFTIYRELFSVTDERREAEPEVAPPPIDEVPNWDETYGK